MDVVQPLLNSGEVLNKFVAGYKKAASHGESDADGREFICQPVVGQNMGPFVADSGFDGDFVHIAASREGQAAFAERLAQPDVAVLAYEVCWGKWAGQLA